MERERERRGSSGAGGGSVVANGVSHRLSYAVVGEVDRRSMVRRCEVGRRRGGSAGRRASRADVAGVIGAGRVYARRRRRVSVERA